MNISPQKFTKIIGKLIFSIKTYVKENWLVCIVLFLVAIFTYGFELFSFDLTIDEEIAAFQPIANVWRLEQGRWGWYILNKIFFPFQIIPFVPLFVGLFFQIISILLFFKIFEVSNKWVQILIGSIVISYPGMVFIYSFVNISYAIGFGLFLINLGLFIFVQHSGTQKYFAILPTTFAMAIYQPLIPVIISVYFLYIIHGWYKNGSLDWKKIRDVILIFFSSLLLYAIINHAILLIFNLSKSGYTEHFFDINHAMIHWRSNLWKLKNLFYNVYVGDKTIYGLKVRMQPIVLFVAGLSILANVIKKRELNTISKIIITGSFGIFLLLPFAGGMLTRGIIPLRSLLIGLPIIIAGWLLLGLENRGDNFKSVFSILAVLCVFQYISAANHLFGSSHLTQKQDRMLATQLILRIEDAKAKSPLNDVEYLEIVGYVDRPSIPAISRIENIGASFFGWDQGKDANRVISFLKTLDYFELEKLPDKRRAEFVDIGLSMPNWPNPASVKVVGDTVLVRFSAYSQKQIESICSASPNNVQIDLCYR